MFVAIVFIPDHCLSIDYEQIQLHRVCCFHFFGVVFVSKVSNYQERFTYDFS